MSEALKDFLLITPELFLVLTLAAVVMGEITYHGEQIRFVTTTALIGLVGSFVQTLLTYQYGSSLIFSSTLSVDGLSLFFKLFFLVLAGFSIAISSLTREIAPERRAEYCVLILASTLAMCLAASAADLLLAFLALQALNTLSYFLIGYGKRSLFSIEAAVKYMGFSAVSGAFLLYGLAILFSQTHTLNIYEMHRALMAAPLTQEISLVVLILIFLSISAQIAAFPMYFWAPDVLEGMPTPASAFLSAGARATGFAVALRFLLVVFSQPALELGRWQVLGSLDWPKILALLSGFSMVLGALLAFRQKGAKRMVGCLVIAESGYLLIGLLVQDQVGVAALLYNLVIELFALVGIFYVLSFFYDELRSDRLEDLKGMLGRAVPESICLVLFLLCLVGIPPLPGFIGKFALIGAAVRHHWPILAVLAIGSMALSTVAVSRLAFHLIGDFKGLTLSTRTVQPNSQRKAFLAIVLVPMLLAGIFANWVLDWAGRSLGFILW